MSDPKEQQSGQDELELDAEIVTDLEPGAEAAEEVRGGATPTYRWCGPSIAC